MSALHSLRRGFGLTVREGVAHPRGLIGREVEMRDGHRFVVFRHTVVGQDAGEGDPAVLIVRFRFWIPGSRFAWFHSIFRPLCIITTPFFVGVPGFRIKLWMEDQNTRDYQGMYEWASADEAIRYTTGLEKILRLLSTKGSVTHEVVPHTSLGTYLELLDLSSASASESHTEAGAA
jgi:hypothetical protein